MEIIGCFRILEFHFIASFKSNIELNQLYYGAFSVINYFRIIVIYLISVKITNMSELEDAESILINVVSITLVTFAGF